MHQIVALLGWESYLLMVEQWEPINVLTSSVRHSEIINFNSFDFDFNFAIASPFKVASFHVHSVDESRRL